MARVSRPQSGTLTYEFKPRWLRAPSEDTDGRMDRLASLLRTLMEARVERSGEYGWEMVFVEEVAARGQKVSVTLLFTDGCEIDALRCLADVLERSRALKVLEGDD